jgi:hypothetical protein
MTLVQHLLIRFAFALNCSRMVSECHMTIRWHVHFQTFEAIFQPHLQHLAYWSADSS